MGGAAGLRAAAQRLRGELARQSARPLAPFAPPAEWSCSRSLDSSIVGLSRRVAGRDVELFVRAAAAEEAELPGAAGQQATFMASVEFLLCVGKAGADRLLAVEGAALEDCLDFSSFAVVPRAALPRLAAGFNRRDSLGHYRGPLFPFVGPRLRVALVEFLEGLGINDGLAEIIVGAAAQHEAELHARLLADFARQFDPCEAITSFEGA